MLNILVYKKALFTFIFINFYKTLDFLEHIVNQLYTKDDADGTLIVIRIEGTE